MKKVFFSLILCNTIFCSDQKVDYSRLSCPASYVRLKCHLKRCKYKGKYARIACINSVYEKFLAHCKQEGQTGKVNPSLNELANPDF